MEKSLKVDKKDREAPNGERNDLCRLMRKEAISSFQFMGFREQGSSRVS